MQYVYVLNKHGEPLMPCSPGKARLLLKQQKAHVIKRTPFTIKLLYGSTGYKQPITLGVDANTPEDAIKKVQKALDANDAGTAMQLGENLSCALHDGGYQVTNAVEVDE